MENKPNYHYLPPLARAYYELLTVGHSRLVEDKGVIALGTDERAVTQDIVILPRTVIPALATLARTVGMKETFALTFALRESYQPRASYRQTRSLLQLADDPMTLGTATACKLILIIMNTGSVFTLYDDILIVRIATKDNWLVLVDNAPFPSAGTLPGAMAVVRELPRNGGEQPLK